MKKLAVVLVALFLVIGCVQHEDSGFVVLDGPVMEGLNDEGNLEFTGVVLNTGPFTVGSVFVVIILKDDDGNVIEAPTVHVKGDDIDDLLFPSERAFFTVSVTVDPVRIFSKDVEIFVEEEDVDAP
ncbi:MAG: hypothetical protein IH874_00975 [Candidatus Dadabacteria bacterium]|nr:hypothetical protein [Candidatus Dadabacteria bacterium]